MGTHPATASPLVHRYRLEEFFALEPPPGGGHYELIAGVLYMVPPPGVPHSLVVSRLVLTFAAYATAHPVDCLLFVPRAAVWRVEEDTFLEPDLFLVTPERVRAHLDGLPSADLVVEVLSPSTAVYDRTAKADTYAALGVRELWLVDHERREIEQRVLDGTRWRVAGTSSGGVVVASVVFPGLRVVPDELFV